MHSDYSSIALITLSASLNLKEGKPHCISINSNYVMLCIIDVGVMISGYYCQPAVCEKCGQMVLRLLYLFHFCLSVCWSVHPTYHVCNIYNTYIVDM